MLIIELEPDQRKSYTARLLCACLNLSQAWHRNGACFYCDYVHGSATTDSSRFERITAHVAHWGWPDRVSPRDTHKDALWVRSEYTQRSCQPEINGFLGSCYSFIIWVGFGSCSLELKLCCCASNSIYVCKHSRKMKLNSFSKDRFLGLALWSRLLGIARIKLQGFGEIWSYSGKCLKRRVKWAFSSVPLCRLFGWC